MDANMNEMITIELKFFLISILWGGLVLLAYDVIRIFRRVLSHNNIFITVEDLLFWFAAGIFIFSMIYEENDGIIRGFSVMGMSIGMVLYHSFISSFLVDLLSKAIQILLTPIRELLLVLGKLARCMGSKTRQFIKFMVKRLKIILISVRIALNKHKNRSENTTEDV